LGDWEIYGLVKTYEIDEKVRIIETGGFRGWFRLLKRMHLGRNTVIGENAYLEKNSTIKGSVISQKV
jgi:NDP-sugar pyrophosphorylase family protein